MKKEKDKVDAPEQEIPAEEKIDANDWKPVEDASVDSILEGNEAEAVKEEAAPAPDPVEELTKELAAAKDKYLYLQAEYQNYRRRAAKDISDARIHAIEDTLVPFLTVSDYLAMAATAADKSENIDAIRQGLQMIIAQFFKAFEDLGVQKFESVGKAFDPKLHEAVSNEPSDVVEEGNIIREWSCGFKIGEKLLRPARVVVSSGPAKQEEEANKEQAE